MQFDLPFTIDGAEASPASARAPLSCGLLRYFQTMGIALKKGRVFDDFDGRETGRASPSSTSRS